MEPYIIANAELSKFSRNYMEQKKELPIRPSEMGVLNIIAETPGPHTSVVLAERLGVSKPMITAHLTSLSEKGYVTREQSAEDRRSFYILLTEKARELVKSAKEGMNRQLDVLAEGMGEEEFEKFVDLARKANQILEANGRNTP